jgi:polyhydroxyalkanoate synthesis regulator phasin
VRSQRVVVADVRVLLAGVLRARNVLGVGDLDFVGERVEDLVDDLVHAVDVVVLEVVRRVHQEPKPG